MINQPTFTCQTRLTLAPGQEALLSAYADRYGRAQRSLFAAMAASAAAWSSDRQASLKPPFMKKFHLTARQYNAVAISLKGKIASIRQLLPVHVSEMEARSAKAENTIKKLEKKDPDPSVMAQLFQKKRLLTSLKHRLAAFKNDQVRDTVSLCFGSNKLFRSQFHLEENGYASHDEWLDDWRHARSREFFVIGSKDETAGCQGCVATMHPDDSISLRLKLPTDMGRWIVLEGLRFAYGQEVIEKALLSGQAISYRFLKDHKRWRVFVSTQHQPVKVVTSMLAGAIGVDLNADHLAVVEIDRFGNFVKSTRIDCITYGKTTEQRKALIGDAVKQIVEMAAASRKPVIIEKLDFKKRKAEAKKDSSRSSRMISSFAYSMVQQMIRAACYRAGVEVISVNPAYTSVIGAVNFAQRFGMSVHQGAALAIARRGLGFSERPAMRDEAVVPARNGDHVTFFLPARNREKHVWSFWSVTRTRLSAVGSPLGCVCNACPVGRAEKASLTSAAVRE